MRLLPRSASNSSRSAPRSCEISWKKWSCKQKRKFKTTTNSNYTLPVAPNLLDQNFTVKLPNQAWVTDISYIPTAEGWLYLAGLKDLFNIELVGYSMAERMTQNLVMQANRAYCVG